jgi:hypothetical protein
MKHTPWLALALVGVIAAPAAAQHDVARRSFNFFDNTLTIQVISESSGSLRIMRGEEGRLEVAARTPDGIPAATLGGRDGDELRLTSVGANPVTFVVSVPEDVRVRVLLPDRKNLEIASTRPAASYAWGATPAKPADGSVPAFVPTSSDGMFLGHSSRAVPRVLALPDISAVSQLEVKFEGSEFRISTSRPVSVQPGRSDEIVFRPGDDPISITIMLPQNARDFRLMLAGRTAIEVVGGDIRSYCQQLIDQRLPDGRRHFTYHPAGGGLVCR